MPDAIIDARLVADDDRPCAHAPSTARQRTNAYRLIHGEGDGLPSLVCDRYDRWLVVQLLSAGLEAELR